MSLIKIKLTEEEARIMKKQHLLRQTTTGQSTTPKPSQKGN